MTTDREVLRFYAKRRQGEPNPASAVAELMAAWALRIEVGVMQHRWRAVAIDKILLRGEAGEPTTEPLRCGLVTATFLESAARTGLVDRLSECGFACSRNDRGVFRDWVPVEIGNGLVPLGFFAPPYASSRNLDETLGRLHLLMKFLEVRSELVFRVVAGRPGWHVLTHHYSTDAAERFRRLFETNAPGVLEFD